MARRVGSLARRFALGIAGAAMALALGACAAETPAETPEPVEPTPVEREPADDTVAIALEQARQAVYDVDPAPCLELGLGLLRNVEAEEGNALVSPISLARPLAMVAEGAQGATLEQLEQVLGTQDLPSYAQELKALSDYWDALAQTTDEDVFGIADSVWVREGYELSEDYLAEVEATFGASLFERPFDQSTADEINAWVSERTHGMIDKLLSSLEPDQTMVVADACAFEGGWESPYEDSQVEPHDFTAADGSVQEVPMMWDSSDCVYLEGEGYTGFRKSYEEGEFAFVALLPNEGSTPEELIANLTGEDLREALRSHEPNDVRTGLPQFKGEFSMDLVGPLEALGLKDAFSSDLADFRAMVAEGVDSPWIGDVIQKTFIEVDEEGTRAAAATGIVMEGTSIAPDDLEPKEVILDRPFVYLIVDTASGVPLFMGTVGSIG